MNFKRAAIVLSIALAILAIGWLALRTRTALHEVLPRESPIPSDVPEVELAETGEDPTLVLHAQRATVMKPPFSRCEDSDAAEGVAVEVPPKAGEEPGALEIPFSIQREGVYSIWLRAYWGTDGERACSNSVRLAIDNLPPARIEDATYEVWHWVAYKRGKSISLSRGSHRLRFMNREDGIRFDQIFITPWYEDEMERRIPQGIE